jgi:hypothetical protein
MGRALILSACLRSQRQQKAPLSRAGRVARKARVLREGSLGRFQRRDLNASRSDLFSRLPAASVANRDRRAARMFRLIRKVDAGAFPNQTQRAHNAPFRIEGDDFG